MWRISCLKAAMSLTLHDETTYNGILIFHDLKFWLYNLIDSKAMNSLRVCIDLPQTYYNISSYFLTIIALNIMPFIKTIWNHYGKSYCNGNRKETKTFGISTVIIHVAIYFSNRFCHYGGCSGFLTNCSLNYLMHISSYMY